ncbi:MAG: hypothetical protein WCO28_11360, partial [Bacteroidota bacterium]
NRCSLPAALDLAWQAGIQLSYRTKFFKNNFPNPDFKYFSRSLAISLVSNSTFEIITIKNDNPGCK